MDLEYWIDYVYEFGIKRKIPLYDHMSFIKYHNIDVLLFLGVLLYLLTRCCCYCLCCRCCRKKVEVEVDDKIKKE